jgi:hypothetical protein
MLEIHRHFVVLSLVMSAAPAIAPAQPPVASPADVGTIADIVRASYEVLSGAAGVPRQWRRDSTLYAPGATFTAIREENGKPVVEVMTPEEYRRKNDARFVSAGLFETEIGSRIERFGNVAQVRSISESRKTTDGPIDGRYINYITLYRDGTRWWMTGWVWDEERPDNPIPKSWIGVREEIPSRRDEGRPR